MAASRAPRSGSVVPGTTGTFAVPASARAAVLLPTAAMASGGRADEHEPRLGDLAREVLALREEAVARMDRLGASAPRGVDEPVGAQVALARRRRADVAPLRRPRARAARAASASLNTATERDAELLARAHDAQRDLAAVRDEDLIETRSSRSATERMSAIGARWNCVLPTKL